MSEGWPHNRRPLYCLDPELLEHCRVAVDSGYAVVVRRVPPPLLGLTEVWELTPVAPSTPSRKEEPTR